MEDKMSFEGFDLPTSAKLVEMGIEAWFDPGAVIFDEGEQSGQFYCITAGSVALEQPGPDRAIRIQRLHRGEFLGWSAFLGSGKRHFRARALSRVSALAFDGSLLRRACEEDPRFGYALTKRLLILVTQRLDATRMLLADVQGRGTDDSRSASASESHF